jgi:glycosyltransferase involved in cell wall biosynthesis
VAERKVIRVIQLTSAHWVFDTRIFHKISKSLARAGYEVILVCRHDRDETVEGISIAAVPRTFGRLRRITVTFSRIYSKAVALDGDIYHFHDPELIPVALRLKLAGKRVVYDAHEDLPRTVLYKDYLPRWLRGIVAWTAERCEEFAARRFTAVVGATPLIADRFRRLNQHTAVVHNFPLPEEIGSNPPQAWEHRTSSVAYVGSICRERGIYEMLDAISRVRPSLDCRLALAGWFSPVTLAEEIMTLPGAGQVDCLGRLSREQVAELLGRVRAGIVVLHPEPNLVNCKPTKLFEYMWAGIPVVASDFPVCRDIVEKAKCGLLVDPRRPDEIAGAIEYLLTHPKEAEEMGRRGRDAAMKFFSWKSEERTLLDLYRTILRLEEIPAAEESNVPEESAVHGRSAPVNARSPRC